jgi:hypothetical protein
MSRYSEKFIERKAELFLEIRNVPKAAEGLLNTEGRTAPGEYVARVQILRDQFNKECQTARYGLMAEELTLHEQLEVTGGLLADNFNGNLGMVK